MGSFAASSKFLESLRLLEITRVLAEIRRWKPGPATLLEIGAGSGWQSRQLAEAGHRVEAIDVPDSRYAGDRVWPIQDYDGQSIPFPDRRFDVVFSSNVLEHIPHVERFQKEIQRVLAPDGIALHLVPGATWRFWTNVTHFLIPLRRWFTGGRAPGPEASNPRLPPRHGETGTALTELYYFSRLRWFRLFRRTGWDIVSRSTNGIFYTGNALRGAKLSLRRRQRLSRILGSACLVYVLRKHEPRPASRPRPESGTPP